MKLVDKTGKEMKIGDNVIDFREKVWKLHGWDEPRHAGSSGRIYVMDDNPKMMYPRSFFPNVCGLEFV